jgi:sulfite exporter TauE/SafE
MSTPRFQSLRTTKQIPEIAKPAIWVWLRGLLICGSFLIDVIKAGFALLGALIAIAFALAVVPVIALLVTVLVIASRDCRRQLARIYFDPGSE